MSVTNVYKTVNLSAESIEMIERLLHRKIVMMGDMLNGRGYGVECPHDILHAEQAAAIIALAELTA